MSTDTVLEQWPTRMVQWRSRRGILELDHILMPFYNHYYHALPRAHRLLHLWLLSQSDTDLQMWLLRGHLPDYLTTQQKSWIQHIVRLMPTLVVQPLDASY